MTPAALACGSITGYASPNMQTLRIAHDAGTVDIIKNQIGVVSGIIGEDDSIECTFDVIPEGASVAVALESASLPAAPSAFTITELPVVEIGGFADALNADTSNPWIYMGGGQINAAADGKWTMSIPLRRYSGITSADIL